MTEMKHYYLRVDAKQLRHFSEQMHLLTGYVGTRVSFKVDPEHGPVDPEGEILGKCYPVLNIISSSMADHVKFLDRDMSNTRKQMAQDIINTINNNESGFDLLMKLQQTLENYEIIGKREFKHDHDDDLPF